MNYGERKQYIRTNRTDQDFFFTFLLSSSFFSSFFFLFFNLQIHPLFHIINYNALETDPACAFGFPGPASCKTVPQHTAT